MVPRSSLIQWGRLLSVDLHPKGSGGYLDPGCRSFQIALGSMIPMPVENLLPAVKNFGVTHIANGALRVNPLEWSVREAAGIRAAFCRERKLTPKSVRNRPVLLEAFQSLPRRQGIELTWPSLTPP